MPIHDLQHYSYRGARAMVILHEQQLRRVMVTWRAAKAAGVKLPVTDSVGFPIQQRGVTAFPGLYFIGMPWLHTQKSGLLAGVGDDAAYIAAHMVASKG